MILPIPCKGRVVHWKQGGLGHKSFIKVLFNPYLRYLGFHIATLVDSNRNPIHYEIVPFTITVGKWKENV